MTIEPHDKDFLIQQIESWTGILMDDSKDYFLESRLRPLISRWEKNDLNDFIQALKDNPSQQMITDVIEAVVTHETSFMRDLKAFNRIKDEILPLLLEKKQEGQPFRIWSSACATGQEPYSMAMLLLENEAFKDVPCEILATDISKHALEKAEKGVYSQFEVQRGLPIQHLVKYFDQVEESWHVRPNTRQMIAFKQRNLMQPFDDLPKFDLILCRNVLIYFREETRVDVLKRMLQHMVPHGVLCLGASEQLMSDATEALGLDKGTLAMYQVAHQ